jgi:hypothetical protein
MRTNTRTGFATMHDAPVWLAILNGSTVLADHLNAWIRQLGSAKLAAIILRIARFEETWCRRRR